MFFIIKIEKINIINQKVSTNRSILFPDDSVKHFFSRKFSIFTVTAITNDDKTIFTIRIILLLIIIPPLWFSDINYTTNKIIDKGFIINKLN